MPNAIRIRLFACSARQGSVSRLVGSNLPIVKRQNRSAVLQTLLRHGPVPRREVGHLTMLTPSTITNLVGELIDQGLVREIPELASPPHVRVGRRPILLEINANGGFVIGVFLGMTTLSVSIGDLRARVLGYRQTAMPSGITEADLVALLVSEITTLLAEFETPFDRVYGLGVIASGEVNSESGMLLDLPGRPWRNVPIVAHLQSRLSLPVAIENSRRAMALAELVFGEAKGVASMILIHLATSIGCSLVINERVYSGDHFGAGRLGHVVVEENGALCWCGKRGCLNTIASTQGIVRVALAEAEAMPHSALWGFHNGDVSLLTALDVLEAADNGDLAAKQAIRKIATALGNAIANLVLILDPSMVVVTGQCVEDRDSLLVPLREIIDSIVEPATGRTANLQLSAFGGTSTQVASFTIALHRFVYSPALSLPNDAFANADDPRLSRVGIEV